MPLGIIGKYFFAATFVNSNNTTIIDRKQQLITKVFRFFNTSNRSTTKRPIKSKNKLW